MQKRITITLTDEERLALYQLAQAEVRPVKEQLRFLVRVEAKRQGLWPANHRQPIAEEAQALP